MIGDIVQAFSVRDLQVALTLNITGDGELTFIYDQSNQLAEVKDGEGVNTIATYTYNGVGQRVKKVAGGVTTVYHYDLEGKLMAESQTNGTMTKEYLYMGKVRVAMVDVAGGGTVYAYQNDRLGTPELLTTRIENGETVVWEGWYEPFGEAHIHPSSSVVNNLRLPGQYFDQETGLHYNYHRYYDPRTGRYVTPDPIGQAGGVNLFLYVAGNPVNSIDPWGLIWEYHIKTGQLWHFPPGGGAAELVGEGYPGNCEGLNYPLYQLEKNVGPIPEGECLYKGSPIDR